MHPLLRFTLDLFESNQPLAQVNQAYGAIDSVVSRAIPPLVPVPLASDLALAANFRHPRANRETRLQGALVAYELKRGQRRTIGFSVGPDGLVVHAPKWVALAELDRALSEKAAWIVRKLGETQARHQQLVANRIDWRDGTTVPFLGAPLTLELCPNPARRAVKAELTPSESGQALRLALPPDTSAEHIRDAVQAWLLPQARQVFTARLDHFAPQLQVQWRKLALSNASTRWGSARIDGSIRLNWRLIHFRQEVIDYVVVHELSHLRFMDHSPRFWDTVRSVVPNYAELREQLKDEGVPRWA